MSYLVLARKYRPQTFDEVVQQTHVTRTLSNAIVSDRVAHAILFSGPRGTGKTTVARILAKAMNCVEGPTPTPCNRCQSCQEIISGHSADVFEIDGASNNSVDQIRELRENVKYMPAHSRFKIYIIDEVHMLSIPAFNALLKTLEEPPAHVMFLFATTEPQKIPITILSRCQRHDFRRVDMDAIIDLLSEICQKENSGITRDSLTVVARESGGSVRDALSLLDQVMGGIEGDARYEDVLEVLGCIDRTIVFDLGKAIIEGDIPRILGTIGDVHSRGHDIKRLFSEILDYFRNLLIVKFSRETEGVLDLPKHEIELMKDRVKDLPAAALSQTFDLLFREEATVRLSVQPRLALEMVLFRIARIKPVLPIDDLIEKMERLVRERPVHETTSSGTVDPKKRDISQGKPQHLPHSDPVDEVPASGMPESPAALAPFSAQDKSVEEIWDLLMDRLSHDHPSLAANLQRSRLTNIEADRLYIEINGNEFNVNMVRREKNLNILRDVVKTLLGREMKLQITAKTDFTQAHRQKSETVNRLKSEALKHPLVSDSIEIFKGTVRDVKINREDME